MGLIGYFDLDPNRALDIILDVLTVNITTHYTFFLSLLSFSPWASSIRRAMAGKLDVCMPPAPSPDQYRGKSLDEVLETAEILSLNYRGLNSVPNGPESRVLAQVLGFKFAYYQVRHILWCIFAPLILRRVQMFKNHHQKACIWQLLY